MDKQLLLSLIKEAQINLVNNPQNYAHEITHHHRTWLVAKEIMPSVSESFDPDIVEVLCWWHDVQIPDLDYAGKRICTVTAEYLSAKVPVDLKDLVLDSIKNHEIGSHPNFTEGKILQDADKLEVLSEERFRIAIDAIKAGLMTKDYFYDAAVIVYTTWLPKMPALYNFDISRELHANRLKVEEPKIREYMKELAAL